MKGPTKPENKFSIYATKNVLGGLAAICRDVSKKMPLISRAEANLPKTILVFCFCFVFC